MKSNSVYLRSGFTLCGPKVAIALKQKKMKAESRIFFLNCQQKWCCAA